MAGRKKKEKKDGIQEISEEISYDELVIAGVQLKDVKKIDKMGRGMFKIELRDGTSQEASLDDGESSIIDHYLSRHLTDDVLASDGHPSAEDIEFPTFNREALERNLGNWMEVEFINPDMVGYWAVNEDIAKYTSLGYVYAKPAMVKFFESTFKDRKPGEGFSPDGPISLNGHTLLVAHKDTSKARHDYYYKERQRRMPQKKEVVHFKG